MTVANRAGPSLRAFFDSLSESSSLEARKADLLSQRTARCTYSAQVDLSRSPRALSHRKSRRERPARVEHGRKSVHTALPQSRSSELAALKALNATQSPSPSRANI